MLYRACRACHACRASAYSARSATKLVALVSLVSAAAAVASACFSSNTTPPLIPDDDGGGLDGAAQLDAESVVDAPRESGAVPEAGPDGADAASSAPEGGDAAGNDASDASTVDASNDGPGTADAADAGDASDAASADAPSDAPTVDAAADGGDASYESISALTFDGVSNWVHLPAAAGGASETAFTVELWFRSRAATGNMFEVYNSGGSADRFLSLNDGQVCFYVYSSPIVQVCTTAATYGDAAWHHAAGTLGAGGVNLYVDGALAASSTATTSSAFTSDTDFRLGMGHTAFVSGIVYLDGDLDEVRVWSVERSASDIAASYRETISPATTGLQGYWKLDESGSAATTADATSGGNDGTLTSFMFTPSPWFSPGAF